MVCTTPPKVGVGRSVRVVGGGFRWAWCSFGWVPGRFEVCSGLPRPSQACSAGGSRLGGVSGECRVGLIMVGFGLVYRGHRAGLGWVEGRTNVVSGAGVLGHFLFYQHGSAKPNIRSCYTQ